MKTQLTGHGAMENLRQVAVGRFAPVFAHEILSMTLRRLLTRATKLATELFVWATILLPSFQTGGMIGKSAGRVTIAVRPIRMRPNAQPGREAA
ncbi:hypothetical protein MX652_02140 [Thauera aromatica]|nr:hypothetical protein [Thauera aromatica]